MENNNQNQSYYGWLWPKHTYKVRNNFKHTKWKITEFFFIFIFFKLLLKQTLLRFIFKNAWHVGNLF